MQKISTLTTPPARPVLSNGTRVRLPDGSVATCYRDTDGTYRTSQVNPVTGGQRADLGWRREQIEAI